MTRKKSSSDPIREPVILGFTGTQYGMTDKQKSKAEAFLRTINPDKVIHGCCIGADKQFVEITRKVFPTIEIEAFPSNIRNKTSAIARSLSDKVHDPETSLRRNKRMIGLISYLLACPSGDTEQMRSGTWATIRYARHALETRRRLLLALADFSPLTGMTIIFPNGKVQAER
jgi:hypothetical protein